MTLNFCCGSCAIADIVINHMDRWDVEWTPKRTLIARLFDMVSWPVERTPDI